MELIRGRKISPGIARGEALVSPEPISFFGGVNPDSGIITERGHPLEGFTAKGKVLVFPGGRGSTVGSYTIYRMKKNQVAPCAMINMECEPIVAVGAIISDIPAMDKLEKNPIHFIRNGLTVNVNADAGIVEILS